MRRLRDRLEFLTGPGGLSATVYWVLKTALRQEWYGVYAKILSTTANGAPQGLQFVELLQAHHLDQIAPEDLDQLNRNSGVGARSLIGNGGRLYALIGPKGPACQLNIALGEAFIDTPAHLTLHLRPNDSFLSFLFTHSAYRRRGLAEALISLVSNQLAKEGFARCVCHISMTNVPSVAAFRRAGWSRVGWLIARANGQMISAAGCGVAGINVQVSKRLR